MRKMEYMTEEPKLERGKKYTMFSVSEMGMTNRIEFTFDEFIHKGYAQYKDTIVMMCKPKGGRKLVGIRLKQNTILFEGWDIPLKIDTDFNMFCGSATINFVGSPEDIKDVLKNAVIIGEKGTIVYVNEDKLHDQNVLFSEDANMEHAVVRRIIERGLNDK